MGFPRQGYCSGLPCPPPGDLSDPGLEPVSLTSPALQVGSSPLAPSGKHLNILTGMAALLYMGHISMLDIRIAPPCSHVGFALAQR